MITPRDFGITDHHTCWPEGSFSPFCDEDWKRMQRCALCDPTSRAIGSAGVRIAGGIRLLNPDGSLTTRYFVCAEHAAFVHGLGY